MFGPLDHVGSWLAYQAVRGSRRRNDHATAEQLAWRATTTLPPGLEMRWIGTAGFRLAYQGTVIWIDPYVTRLPMNRFALRRVTVPNDAEIDQWIDRADAVLIGHTHFDHALDAPRISAKFGCPVYGSSSLAHLMLLSGVPDRAVTVEPYQTYEVGPFKFSFIPSVHSKLALGLSIPSGGELTCEHLDHLTPQAYRCGQVWGLHIEVAGVSFYHQGSADLIDDAIRARNVDYFLCGIAGRRFTKNYLPRILGKLNPRVIVPTHYDNFFQPLERPLDFSMNVNLTSFADEVRAVSADFNVQALPLTETVGTT